MHNGKLGPAGIEAGGGSFDFDGNRADGSSVRAREALGRPVPRVLIG